MIYDAFNLDSEDSSSKEDNKTDCMLNTLKVETLQDHKFNSKKFNSQSQKHKRRISFDDQNQGSSNVFALSSVN